VNGRSYLSIGDVLTLLRQEFPDITISKIRFLESQGLVNPERTPSGYRKFYEPDVERLRWVLRQQREHFLPLKVIKGRLEDDPEGHVEGQGNGRNARAGAGTAATTGTSRPATVASRRRGGGPPLPGMVPSEQTPATAGLYVAEPGPPVGVADVEPAAPRGGEENTPERARSAPAKPSPAPAVLAEGDMTLEELAAASSCSPANLHALESYGLLSGRVVGGVTYYGQQALEVARLAQAFAGFGVEARHLRLHKHAADREAGFIEQVVLPLLKQRNPESRQRAHDTVAELARLGQELRAVLLARVLRDQLGG